MAEESDPVTKDDIQPIRDQMAIDRTILANERTMLAYMRTALTLLILAVALIKFVEDPIVVTIGVVLIPIALATAIIGFRLYSRRRDTITRLYGSTPFTAPGIPPSDQSSS